MSAKKFLIQTFGYSVLFIGVLAAINVAIDSYGLFRNVEGREISIAADERTSKYLLAHRYVPSNFEGYIVGPSLSANMDTRLFKDRRIYNLSMMGANITEESAVVRKALEHKIPSVVIICLHPYLTLDHGMKTGMINEKEYWGALGSVSIYKSYALWMVRKLDLSPYKYPKDQFNSFGLNDYEMTLAPVPVEKKIEEQLMRDDAIKADIDPVAWEEFKSLVNDLNAKNVKIVTYFHPLPYPIQEKFHDRLDGYKKTMKAFLEGKATIVDFTTNEEFTKDLSNYVDHGHLSKKGQAYLVQELSKQIN